jgi:hypothetical protein
MEANKPQERQKEPGKNPRLSIILMKLKLKRKTNNSKKKQLQQICRSQFSFGKMWATKGFSLVHNYLLNKRQALKYSCSTTKMSLLGQPMTYVGLTEASYNMHSMLIQVVNQEIKSFGRCLMIRTKVQRSKSKGF